MFSGLHLVFIRSYLFHGRSHSNADALFRLLVSLILNVTSRLPVLKGFLGGRDKEGMIELVRWFYLLSVRHRDFVWAAILLLGWPLLIATMMLMSSNPDIGGVFLAFGVLGWFALFACGFEVHTWAEAYQEKLRETGGVPVLAHKRIMREFMPIKRWVDMMTEIEGWSDVTLLRDVNHTSFVQRRYTYNKAGNLNGVSVTCYLDSREIIHSAISVSSAKYMVYGPDGIPFELMAYVTPDVQREEIERQLLRQYPDMAGFYRADG